MRYIIGTFRTYERAEMVLEEMFANGEICEGERPRIERSGNRWAITAQG